MSKHFFIAVVNSIQQRQCRGSYSRSVCQELATGPTPELRESYTHHRSLQYYLSYMLISNKCLLPFSFTD
jgi:hypothetical protein